MKRLFIVFFSSFLFIPKKSKKHTHFFHICRHKRVLCHQSLAGWRNHQRMIKRYRSSYGYVDHQWSSYTSYTKEPAPCSAILVRGTSITAILRDGGRYIPGEDWTLAPLLLHNPATCFPTVKPSESTPREGEKQLGGFSKGAVAPIRSRTQKPVAFHLRFLLDLQGWSMYPKWEQCCNHGNHMIVPIKLVYNSV